MTCRSIQIKAKMAASVPVSVRAPAASTPVHAPVELPPSPADDALMALDVDAAPDRNDAVEKLSGNDVIECLASGSNTPNGGANQTHVRHRTSTPQVHTQRSRTTQDADVISNASNGNDPLSAPNHLNGVDDDGIVLDQSAIVVHSDTGTHSATKTNGVHTADGDVSSACASAAMTSSSDTPDTYHSATPSSPPLTPVVTAAAAAAAGDDADAASDELLASHNSGTQTDDECLHESLRVPIQGYEVMEERSRFTVFKVQVRKNDLDSWFIFRRYTDFVRLNDKLKTLFPHFRLALPPKRWFGDNFDREFLDDRLLGLQAFLNNVSGHKDVVASEAVRRFLCLDDPPGPHDSVEESRALCEALEETNYTLQRELDERDRRVRLLEEELQLQSRQIDNLKRVISRLKGVDKKRVTSPLSSATATVMTAAAGGVTSLSRAHSDQSLVDTSTLTEADQQRYASTDWSETPVTRRSPVKDPHRGGGGGANVINSDRRLSQQGNLSMVASMETLPEETECKQSQHSPLPAAVVNNNGAGDGGQLDENGVVSASIH